MWVKPKKKKNFTVKYAFQNEDPILIICQTRIIISKRKKIAAVANDALGKMWMWASQRKECEHRTSLGITLKQTVRSVNQLPLFQFVSIV